MKIMPTMNCGIPWVLENGRTVEVIPFQVWRTRDGMSVIRIGQNTVWLNEDGTLDGFEARVSEDISDAERELLITAIRAWPESASASPEAITKQHVYYVDAHSRLKLPKKPTH